MTPGAFRIYALAIIGPRAWRIDAVISRVIDWDNLRAAFVRVEASEGMAGVDGVSIARFRRELDVNLDLLSRELAGRKYLPLPLRLIRLWVKAEVYDGEKVYALCKGICQGSVISPMLANLFLDELDEGLLSRGYQLVRYSDDFIVHAKSRPEAERALECTEEILERLHLVLDHEDTHVTDFERGFKYLGLLFVGDNIFAPFDRPRREKRILYMPPPFDLAGYLAGRRGAQPEE